MESRKIELMIYFQDSNGERDMEDRPMDMAWGEDRESEMYGENNMGTYNAICKIDSQWQFAIWLRELKLCNNLGGRDGREFWEGGDMGVPMVDSCWCLTENHKIM